MFYNASAFNGDLSSWNTEQVTEMRSMFQGATDFNQDLSGWCVKNLTDETNQYNDFATGSPLANDNQNLPIWGLSCF